MAETVREWLVREVAKAKIARAKIQAGRYRSGEQLFLLERAQKAEATARVLRKVLKIEGPEGTRRLP